MATIRRRRLKREFSVLLNGSADVEAGIGCRCSLLLCALHCDAADAKGQRTLSGIIYFTNNTPKDVEQFPVELFSAIENAMVAATTLIAGTVRVDRSQAGKYLLKIAWPNHCVLWYRVNLTKQSRSDVRVIMDAACAHADGSIQELPEN